MPNNETDSAEPIKKRYYDTLSSGGYDENYKASPEKVKENEKDE